MSRHTLTGRALVAGAAEGVALVLDEPLSFWGGVDPASGRIIDPRHPQYGQCVTGTILIMPAGRGSSSSSAVLAECLRAGTAPSAIAIGQPDQILLLGAIVAEELYGKRLPLVVVDRSELGRVRSGALVRVEGQGAGGNFKIQST